MGVVVRLFVILALALVASGARAFELAGRPASLVASVGALTPGSLTFHHGGGTFELDASASPVLSAMLDLEVFRTVSLGARLNAARMALARDYDLGYDAEWGRNLVLTSDPFAVLELMVSGKMRIVGNDRMRLGIAVYLGLLRAFTDDRFKQDVGVGANVAFEGRWMVRDTFFLFAEAGLVTQPFGGVSDVGYVSTTHGLGCLTLGAGF